MIEINLLPDHLRKKRRSSIVAKTWSIPRGRIPQFLGALVVFLVSVHVVLQALITIQVIRHKKYQSQLEEFRPASIKAQSVMGELRKLQGKTKAVTQVIGEKKIFWSQKLNVLSDQLPRGVWLTKVSLDHDSFLIYGSAVSKNKDKMVGIHQFVADLKKNGGFLKGFKRIELGVIKSRAIQTTEVADFTILVELEKNDNKPPAP